ncbi:MAG: peptidase M52 [Actinobacteria bacterium]|nr:MAG: peptidase M52 [Actinomycetota bacterium]REK38674.1 MAG: peptidase M52 [Actinomycetota bacterium]
MSPKRTDRPKVLIACVGNILRSDDGVGPRVAEILEGHDLPEGVDVLDFGIGGVHLVQTLLTGEYGALVLVDCADRGRDPGTVMVIQPDVLDVAELEGIAKYDYLADMHYTNPERAMALARALGVLPERTLLLGIQPMDAEKLGRDLTPEIEVAAHVAAEEALRLSIEMLGVGHDE